MKELDTNEMTSKPEANQTESFQKHWFCVAQTFSGTTIKQDAESPADFPEILKQANIAWIDYRTDNFDRDAPLAAARMGFSDALISSLTGESPLTYQDLETEMGIRYPSIQIREFNVQLHPLLLLLRKSFILSIHPITVDRRFIRLRRYSDTVLRKIPADACAEDKLALLLIRIIDEANERNFEHLRQIEEQGDALHKELTNPDMPRETLGPKIYDMKHALITYLDALWHSVDVLNALRYGDAELITDNAKLLARMTLLADDVNRQIGLAEHLSEVLASGLEVLQTIYNNQLQVLNNRMALVIVYLTIVGTAVLVPNTLATIFSNSAFDMQSNDIWWYVTLLVVSTVVSTWFVYWFLKKRGWIPKSMD